jgi:hypothetical protein
MKFTTQFEISESKENIKRIETYFHCPSAQYQTDPLGYPMFLCSPESLVFHWGSRLSCGGA